MLAYHGDQKVKDAALAKTNAHVAAAAAYQTMAAKLIELLSAAESPYGKI